VEEWLQKDPGMPGRFPVLNRVEFQKLSVDTLVEIGIDTLKGRSYHLAGSGACDGDDGGNGGGGSGSGDGGNGGCDGGNGGSSSGAGDGGVGYADATTAMHACAQVIYDRKEGGSFPLNARGMIDAATAMIDKHSIRLKEDAVHDSSITAEDIFTACPAVKTYMSNASAASSSADASLSSGNGADGADGSPSASGRKKRMRDASDHSNAARKRPAAPKRTTRQSAGSTSSSSANDCKEEAGNYGDGEGGEEEDDMEGEEEDDCEEDDGGGAAGDGKAEKVSEAVRTTLTGLFVSDANATIGIRRAVSVCVSEDNIFNHLVLQAESQKTKKTMNANRDKAVAIDEANYTTVFNEPVVQLLQGVFPEIHYDPKKQCFWPDTTGIRQKLITGLQAR